MMLLRTSKMYVFHISRNNLWVKINLKNSDVNQNGMQGVAHKRDCTGLPNVTIVQLKFNLMKRKVKQLN